MTDAQLDAAAEAVAGIEGLVRRHLLVAHAPFEQARGQETSRIAVSLRKSLERWMGTRADLARLQHGSD